MDRLEKAEAFGHIPPNIGYNPYWGWRWTCKACASGGALLAYQVPKSLQKRFKVGFRFHRCNACRAGWRTAERPLTRAEALHRNDMIWRDTRLDKNASVANF